MPDTTTTTTTTTTTPDVLPVGLVRYRRRLYACAYVPAGDTESLFTLLAVLAVEPPDRAAVLRLLRLFHRLARPLPWWGRLPWRLRRNPFRAATAIEAGEVAARLLLVATAPEVGPMEVKVA